MAPGESGSRVQGAGNAVVQEESGGVRALVMELVEGEDLAGRLIRGPIPIDEALRLAEQIAEALEAAHEHGIIHRDLKPANIKVREDGTVKVLDIGLAKAMDRDPSSCAAAALADPPTITNAAGQMAAGIILGPRRLLPGSRPAPPTPRRVMPDSTLRLGLYSPVVPRNRATIIGSEARGTGDEHRRAVAGAVESRWLEHVDRFTSTVRGSC